MRLGGEFKHARLCASSSGETKEVLTPWLGLVYLLTVSRQCAIASFDSWSVLNVTVLFNPRREGGGFVAPARAQTQGTADGDKAGYNGNIYQ